MTVKKVQEKNKIRTHRLIIKTKLLNDPLMLYSVSDLLATAFYCNFYTCVFLCCLTVLIFEVWVRDVFLSMGKFRTFPHYHHHHFIVSRIKTNIWVVAILSLRSPPSWSWPPIRIPSFIPLPCNIVCILPLPSVLLQH